ncbi:hypothetical protein [Campylobacter gastrosuis]|uniref:Uncharacterized protein n=1 Tax=Campylobacter gastrosuis TaxID=2974576 RepID=A0ABT7HRW0_9BACT|nr:hypothetical protein [Campylobacter gastrosuis]MDL0089646.1 hypothetical protein [Campylobacter gastrosuis]
MQTISIQTENSNIIEAIKAIIALDPKSSIVYDDINLSQTDKKDLEKLIKADKCGKLKYQTFDEFKAEMRAYVKSIGS